MLEGYTEFLGFIFDNFFFTETKTKNKLTYQTGAHRLFGFHI